MWALLEVGIEIHAVPIDDLRPHEPASTCWCHPVEDAEPCSWAHNSLDGRDAYEDGTMQLH